jgi:undecaprenyl-diphosphatase
MSWWEAIILGLLQGIAEFLPVSSSGHLVLGQHLLGFDADQAKDITFEVFLHFGTVLSIVTVYRQRIGSVIVDFLRALGKPSLLRQAVQAGSVEKARTGVTGSVRLALFILLSMIPTGLIYVLFGDQLEALFDYPRVVCDMLLVTGTLLLLARFRPNPTGVFSWMKVLLVGLAQGAALIPGISRSGATICTAIYQNVDRKEAADFSFLMSLPVIVGATLLKIIELFEVGASVNWLPIVLGTVVAYVSGIWAIKVMIAFVQRGDLIYFAIYCFVIGTLGLIFI